MTVRALLKKVTRLEALIQRRNDRNSESSTTTLCCIAPRSQALFGNEGRFFELEHCIWADGYWRLQ
jgi:hypothetical protein